ncbi:MAG: type I polyketide synthase, partial [Myxococcota bacterium]
PSDVDFVEAHGTGTPLGDPIEMKALNAVYGERRSAQCPLWVGAMKANFGHLEAAAGLAALVKTILSLEQRTIVPNIHFGEPNRQIPWADIGISIPTKAMPWTSTRRRLAAVSSIGVTGSNAHVVVEEAPVVTAEVGSDRDARLFLISGHTSTARDKMVKAYIESLQKMSSDQEAASLAAAAAVHRGHHRHRLIAPWNTRVQLIESLQAHLAGQSSEETILGQRLDDVKGKVVFVYPGQGGQWVRMGRALAEYSPGFRASIDECVAAFSPYWDWSHKNILDEEPGDCFLQIDYIQPVLFAIQVGLTRFWAEWGLKPDVVLGHSMGEVAASHVAGILSLPQAAKIICLRSKLMRQVRGRGAMAMVELEEAQARVKIRDGFSDLEIAVVNGARATVVAGDTDKVDGFLQALTDEGIYCRRIKVDVASHSRHVEPLTKELQRLLSDISPRVGETAMMSTVNNQFVQGPELNGSYWVRNLRDPVQFKTGLEQLIAAGANQYVEISPHSTLLPYIEEALDTAEASSVVVSSLRRDEDDRTSMTRSAGMLLSRGAELDLSAMFPSHQVVPLPPYAFERQRFWPEGPKVSGGFNSADGASLIPMLGQRLDTPGEIYIQSVGPQSHDWISDHSVFGTVVLPGAFYVATALAAAQNCQTVTPARGTKPTMEQTKIIVEPAKVDTQR